MLPTIASMFSGICKFFFYFYESRCFILNQNIEITGSEQNILCEKKVPKHLKKFPSSHSGVYAEDGCPHGTSLSFRTRVPSNPTPLPDPIFRLSEYRELPPPLPILGAGKPSPSHHRSSQLEIKPAPCACLSTTLWIVD